ncbi:DNA polymerase II [Halobacteriovorax sp. GB3]|uniref:DNA polymerase II n=1 Tax=Halobacteriovorax sp. GB3 TaxID=2719615 RepID=UPI0023602205|nr:DNA polymerase II [Halobacteriovorax sp. GB3]MDD0853846.1 DNA polymerase II [Halobacteriovorax sp. GB3]
MQGFILTAAYEDRAQGHLLKYFGISDQGPFCVIIDQNSPVFFIEREAKFSRLSVSYERKSVGLKSFRGQAVDALYFKTQRDLFTARDELQRLGVRSYEADVRAEERYLMERFVNGSVQIDGPSKVEEGMITFLNPKLSKTEYRPRFHICSLDIETSFGNDLYSIGVHYKGPKGEYKHVHMVGEDFEKRDENLTIYPGEAEVLKAFYDEFIAIDPDIIIGWHIIGFDFKFLERKFSQYGLRFNIGRKKSKCQITEKKGAGWFCNMDGRVVVDGPPALRAAFYQFENFKLETVAKELLGVGKDISSAGSDKVEEIERRFHEDKAGLAKYNLLDCTLVHDIYEKTGLLNLIVTRTLLSGLLMDRIGVSTAAFDYFMLPKIHRKGFVANNVIDIQREGHAAGGHVLEPKEGLHENIIVFDFKSLYPSIIRTFKIDPYSRIMAQVNTIETPTGHQFSKTEHILPHFISILFNKRAEAKMIGDQYLSQAIKILMNSFYGVMGSGGSRFYHADLPTAITGTGQWILKKAIVYLEDRGYEVVYGDTDSVFVKIVMSDTSKMEEKSSVIAKGLNEYFQDLLLKEYGVHSELEIEYEKHYRKLYLPPARSGEGGAKKRYAGLIINKNGEREIKFAGMEFVRSDWTKLAKRFQYGLYQTLFGGEEVKDYIQDFIKVVKDKVELNELIYTKRLTKDASEYIKSVPPHVKAAKILLEKDPGRSIRRISYVITRRGPMPVELGPTDIDFQHYIDKQLRPIAEDVLRLKDINFDDLVMGDQLTLF